MSVFINSTLVSSYLAGSRAAGSLVASSLGERGDLVRQGRHLPARIVLVNDVALRCLHQLRFRALHRFQRRIAVAALDCFLDGADRATHLGAARLVDDGAAGNLAGGFLGRSGIGHVLNYPSAVVARVVGLERAGRSNCVIDAGCVFQGVLT
jgi:hypothetical protein